MLRKFLRDENGATAIEYSLIAGFIALAIIAAVGMTGDRLVALFEKSYSGVDAALTRQVTINTPLHGGDCEADQKSDSKPCKH